MMAGAYAVQASPGQVGRRGFWWLFSRKDSLRHLAKNLRAKPTEGVTAYAGQCCSHQRKEVYVGWD